MALERTFGALNNGVMANTMSNDQILILVILLSAIVLFLWGRWRHDIVAAATLLACVFTGLVAPELAFSGFAHPAVITVGCVLVLSFGLQTSGAIDAVALKLMPSSERPMLNVAALIAIGAVLSGFINNIGALALLMPVALQLARRQKLPPGRVLMPLSFGTILGGMTTMIGTPPNLIVASFREQTGMESFAMFDFTPVGLAVALFGVLFVVFIGWRLVPDRRQDDAGSFDTGKYLTEVRVEEDSDVIGKTLRKVEEMLEKADAQIVGLVRNELQVIVPHPRSVVRKDDILIIEAEPESLAAVLSSLDLHLEEAVERREESTNEESEQEDEEEKDSKKKSAKAKAKEKSPSKKTATAEESAADAAHIGETIQVESGEYVIQELGVMAGASIIGQSATDLQLRTLYGLNLLAVSREGRRSIKRLRTTPIQAGDLLMMQGAPESLSVFASEFGCVPLAARAIRIPSRRKAIIASVVLLLSIAGAAFGVLPAAIAFATGVLAFMVLRILPLRKVYNAVDWPVIVLLAALIPVAEAMEITGTADLVARGLLENIAQGQPIVALTLILIVTMTLSDFMNNAATAAVMCPLSISAAQQLGVNPDAFLMAVAVGASCAFLTPIGHQNNTLILGPGGFRFGDYWRLGLPMEILVVAVAVPMLLWIWPL